MALPGRSFHNKGEESGSVQDGTGLLLISSVLITVRVEKGGRIPSAQRGGQRMVSTVASCMAFSVSSLPIPGSSGTS